MEVKTLVLEVRRTLTEYILLKWKFENVLMGRTDAIEHYVIIYVYLFTKQIY